MHKSLAKELNLFFFSSVINTLLYNSEIFLERTMASMVDIVFQVGNKWWKEDPA